MADLVTLDGIQSVGRRPLTSTEVGMAQQWIPLLSAIIRSRVPGIDTRIASGDLDISIVSYVASEMLINRFEAPQFGVTQHAQTVGPISDSKSFDKNAPAGLVLTAELLSMLMPIPDAGVSSHRLQSGWFPPAPAPVVTYTAPATATPTEIVVNVNGGLV